MARFKEGIPIHVFNQIHQHDNSALQALEAFKLKQGCTVGKWEVYDRFYSSYALVYKGVPIAVNQSSYGTSSYTVRSEARIHPRLSKPERNLIAHMHTLIKAL